jgi:hypothetical protein
VDKAVVSPTLSTLGITLWAFPLINRPNEWKQKEFFRKKFNQKLKVGKTGKKRFSDSGLAPTDFSNPAQRPAR